MAYGFNPRLFLENGPAVEAQRARQGRSTNSFRAWRKLHRDSRFELVDRALKAPANDHWRAQPVRRTGENDNDNYPIAL